MNKQQLKLNLATINVRGICNRNKRLSIYSWAYEIFFTYFGQMKTLNLIGMVTFILLIQTPHIVEV
jgi:hypothetical protein